MSLDQICKHLREMDASYNTQPTSPLHHNNRCALHRHVRMHTFAENDEIGVGTPNDDVIHLPILGAIA